jgi:hypothetical protein
MMPIQTPSNPFALLMHPETVLHAIEHSDRLGRLQSRVCRPLDKPLIPRVAKDVAEFDRRLDAAAVIRDE